MADLRSLHLFSPDTADLPPLTVLLAAPRGFCAGVRRAITAVEDALRKHGAPVYVRHAIVHNRQVVRDLERQGAIFVEDLDEVPEGSIVIFSAHGVSPAVSAQADRRGLRSFDAVCPLVAKVHHEVERHQRQDRKIVLIGHAGHPEVEGTVARLDGGNVFIVKTPDDVAALPLPRDTPAAYAVQTTYSVDDASKIIAALRERFSNLAEPSASDICYATTNRQAAVREIAARADAFIIVGEHFSSNACRLAELAAGRCPAVQLIAGPDEVDWPSMPARGTVGLSAAASTPESSVQAVLAALGERYRLNVETSAGPIEATEFRPLAV